MKHSVYLAGPIAGLTYDQGRGWRDLAAGYLAAFDIKALSPLRGKQFLGPLGPLSSTGAEYEHLSVLATPRGIMTRDRFDATRCDVLFVNLLGAKAISIGSIMELAWADAARIPIVCAIERAGNVHEHAMVDQALGYRVPNLLDALDVVTAILS